MAHRSGPPSPLNLKLREIARKARGSEAARKEMDVALHVRFAIVSSGNKGY